MYKIAEMVRASFVIAKSYKINLMFSILALFFTTIPIYLAAHAMQPTMAKMPRWFPVMVGTCSSAARRETGLVSLCGSGH